MLIQERLPQIYMLMHVTSDMHQHIYPWQTLLYQRKYLYVGRLGAETQARLPRMILHSVFCCVLLAIWCAFDAAHCNKLQRTATHCNTLQHTAPHYNTLRHNDARHLVCL